jgi:hypothetical protein
MARAEKESDTDAGTLGIKRWRDAEADVALPEAMDEYTR